MRLVALPQNTSIPFMRYRRVAAAISLALCVASVAVFGVFGMNYGIDFRGGTMVELRFEEPADIGELRRDIGDLNLGDVQIVEFGRPTDVLIRVEEQPGGEAAQQRAVILLREIYEPTAEFRRVEVVGPRVSGELARAGLFAVVGALLAIMAYIWLRFEWHFAVGAVLTTLHDVILTVGLFAATRIEFNLSSIAAVLTIVGYSLNDTVVVYDRVRENLRRYKRMTMPDLIDASINQMLSRTIMTSVTTLLALGALFVFGGEVIRSFTFAMIWGILVGTFSSIFIAAPLLITLNLRPQRFGTGAADDGSADEGTRAAEAELADEATGAATEPTATAPRTPAPTGTASTANEPVTIGQAENEPATGGQAGHEPATAEPGTPRGGPHAAPKASPGSGAAHERPTEEPDDRDASEPTPARGGKRDKRGKRRPARA